MFLGMWKRSYIALLPNGQVLPRLYLVFIPVLFFEAGISPFCVLRVKRVMCKRSPKCVTRNKGVSIMELWEFSEDDLRPILKRALTYREFCRSITKLKVSPVFRLLLPIKDGKSATQYSKMVNSSHQSTHISYSFLLLIQTHLFRL